MRCRVVLLLLLLFKWNDCSETDDLADTGFTGWLNQLTTETSGVDDTETDLTRGTTLPAEMFATEGPLIAAGDGPVMKSAEESGDKGEYKVLSTAEDLEGFRSQLKFDGEYFHVKGGTKPFEAAFVRESGDDIEFIIEVENLGNSDNMAVTKFDFDNTDEVLGFKWYSAGRITVVPFNERSEFQPYAVSKGNRVIITIPEEKKAMIHGEGDTPIALDFDVSALTALAIQDPFEVIAFKFVVEKTDASIRLFFKPGSVALAVQGNGKAARVKFIVIGVVLGLFVLMLIAVGLYFLVRWCRGRNKEKTAAKDDANAIEGQTAKPSADDKPDGTPEAVHTAIEPLVLTVNGTTIQVLQGKASVVPSQNGSATGLQKKESMDPTQLGTEVTKGGTQTTQVDSGKASTAGTGTKPTQPGIDGPLSQRALGKAEGETTKQFEKRAAIKEFDLVNPNIRDERTDVQYNTTVFSVTEEGRPSKSHVRPRKVSVDWKIQAAEIAKTKKKFHDLDIPSDQLKPDTRSEDIKKKPKKDKILDVKGVKIRDSIDLERQRLPEKERSETATPLVKPAGQAPPPDKPAGQAPLPDKSAADKPAGQAPPPESVKSANPQA